MSTAGIAETGVPVAHNGARSISELIEALVVGMAAECRHGQPELLRRSWT
jgi:hypothetical protein